MQCTRLVTPRLPGYRSRPGRLVLLLLGLGVLAAGLNGEALQRWRYQRYPLEGLVAAARTHPDDLVLAEVAGERLLANGQALPARDLLLPVAQRHLERSSVLILAGRAAWMAGDAETGGALLHRAIEQSPTNPEARYWTAEFLFSRGYARDARSLLQEVVQLAPEYGAAWWRLGEIELNDEHFPQALAYLDRAERYHPTAATAHARAVALRSLGRLPEAEAAARAAYQRQASAANAALLGEILEATPGAASLSRAQTLFREAIRLDPQAVDSYKLLAVNQRSQGQHAEAVKTLRRMLRLAPAMSEGYLLLGQSYQARGQHVLAAAVLRTYRALEPYETRLSRAEYQANVRQGSVPAQLELAKAYLETGRQDLAREVLARVLRKAPQHREALALRERAAGPPTLKIPPLPRDPAGDAP